MGITNIKDDDKTMIYIVEIIYKRQSADETDLIEQISFSEIKAAKDFIKRQNELSAVASARLLRE